MKRREFQRLSLRLSLVLHGAIFALLLVLPWFLEACALKKPVEKLMFVEFTVSVPPPSAPEMPIPEAPTSPPSEDIAEPAKKSEPERQPTAPKRDIRQTNRVVRRGPPPKDQPLSPTEIERLIKLGAKISDTTQVPTGSQLALGAYYNHVHERMYAVWQQPSQLKDLPGLRTVVNITVAPDGRITRRTRTSGSGNALMDDSVMAAVNSIKALRALPPGHREPVQISILFEIAK